MLKDVISHNPLVLTQIVSRSDLFDADWYKETYHVNNPAWHYVTKGGDMGYDPSPKFHSSDYLLVYPDVRESGYPPLVHYELHGKKEGRSYQFTPGELEGASKVPMAQYVSHDKWPQFLAENFNKEGVDILEVGSRVVTGSNFSTLFPNANYTGFDIYPGENVDIVGDAHHLTDYLPEGKQFDLIFASAVFEHLAMPWIAADEIIKALKVGGYVFIETHYSYSAHERPWHFFQFSDQALKVLFSPAHGIECIEAGVSNPIRGEFTGEADEILRGTPVNNMFCHTEFLGKKVKEVPDFSYEDVPLNEIVGNTTYPKPKITLNSD